MAEDRKKTEEEPEFKGTADKTDTQEKPDNDKPKKPSYWGKKQRRSGYFVR